MSNKLLFKNKILINKLKNKNINNNSNDANTDKKNIYENFDWKTYIENYEDLRRAGIDNKKKALIHWIKYGKNEGRQYIFSEDHFDKLYPDFDIKYYKSKYNDMKNITDYEVKKHYFIYGCHQKRLYNNKIKIIIVCDEWNDIDCRIATGGNLALYNLGKLINEKTSQTNIYAKMYPFNRINKKNPYCNQFANDNEINDRTILLYPDGNEYNPLKSKYVIRWILLEIGTKYRDSYFYKKWDKTDFVYHWEKSLNNEKIKILNITNINPLFYNKKYTKSIESCYLIKKRNLCINEKINYIHPKYSILIDNLKTEEISEILNKSEYFYCYDLKSFLMIAGILCNTKVILIPDNRTKEEFINNSIFNNFIEISKFFAWGINDIQSINYNDDDLIKIIKYIENLSSSVDIFLDDIDSFFNNKTYNIPTVYNIYYK